jgi:hypothetical protein
MHTVYFEQIHPLHYISIPLPLFQRVSGGFHYAVFIYTYVLQYSSPLSIVSFLPLQFY